MTGDTLGDLLERRADGEATAGDGEATTDEGEAESEREGKRKGGRSNLRTEATALRAPGDPERRYDAARLLTDARKTGNFLRQLGVGPGRTVAVADTLTPESVLTLFGAALLGAPTRFVAADTLASEALDAEARVLVGPVDEIDSIPVNVAERVAYGGTPDDPEVAYFERDVWSENPTFPPGGPEGAAIAIEARETEYTHRQLMDAAAWLITERGLEAGIEMAVRAPLADPRTVVAGVLAPLACGGTVLLPDADARGDRAVVALDVGWGIPESATIDLADVPLDGRRTT